MKNWIQKNYTQEDMTPPLLKRVVREAWDAVGSHEFQVLIGTMQQRCRDVIAANGLYTPW